MHAVKLKTGLFTEVHNTKIMKMACVKYLYYIRSSVKHDLSQGEQGIVLS